MPDYHRMDTIGPLFLILLPGILLLKKKKSIYPSLFFILIYTGLISFFEVLRFQAGASIRYSTPVIALLCPLAVYSWKEGLKAIRPVSVIASFFVTAAIILNLIISFKRYRNDIAAVCTAEPQQEYLLKNLAEYPAVYYANTHLMAKDTIMTSNCFGSYYLNIPYYCAFRKYADSSQMITDFNKLGVNYLLANDILDKTKNVNIWKGNYSEKIFEKNGVYVYRFKNTIDKTSSN